MSVLDAMTSNGHAVIMTEVLSVADAKRRFSELIERVGQGERFVVTRRGNPVIGLVPLADVPSDEKPQKRGFMVLWGVLEGVDGADEWYEEMQRIVADRRNWMPRDASQYD